MEPPDALEATRGIQLVGGAGTTPTLFSTVGPAGLFPMLDFLDACRLRRTCPDGRGEIGRHTRLQGWAACGWVKTEAGMAEEEGCVDGEGAEARFSSPWGVAVTSAGVVYIADTSNHVIRRLGPDGRVTTCAGKAGEAGSADGCGATARFRWPSGLAVDEADNLYVADMYNHLIRRIDPTGNVTTVAGKAGEQGSVDGVGAEARFNTPFGLAVDKDGNVLVADSENHTIRRIDTKCVVTTFAGVAGQTGSVDGVGPAARFKWPFGIAVGLNGHIFITDRGNQTIRKLSSGGKVTTLAGMAGEEGSADGVGAEARFKRPWGIAVDRRGIVYVADRSNATIRCISPVGKVHTLTGAAGQVGSVDGLGPKARLVAPAALTINAAGTMYLTDRCAVRRLF